MVEATAGSILAISLLGAAGEAAVTLRWYEPPPPPDEGGSRSDGSDPTPLLEAGFFAAVFGVLFSLLGWILAWVAAVAPPYSRFGLLVLTPIGAYVAYAAVTGRVEGYADRAQIMMWAVGGLVVGAYPLAFLLG